MRDYCYRNVDDTVRYKVFYRHECRMWDIDFFYKTGKSETYSLEAADAFLTKRGALAYLNEIVPQGVTSFNPGDNVRNGWPKI